MTILKDALHKLLLSDGISNQWPRFMLNWAEQTAGFDIFDLTSEKGGKLSIGDDADYLHLFMAISDRIYQADNDFKPLTIACDTGGNRVYIRYYTEEDKKQFKYSYIALGNAAKALPESAINGKFSFFAEVSLEKATADGFETEAKKAARTMSGEVKQAWEALIEQKSDFIKTDLYVFHLLKLYSWGFKTVNQGDDNSQAYQFVRGQRPKPRGTSRH